MGATDPQVHVERASRLSDNHVVERARKPGYVDTRKKASSIGRTTYAALRTSEDARHCARSASGNRLPSSRKYTRRSGRGVARFAVGTPNKTKPPSGGCLFARSTAGEYPEGCANRSGDAKRVQWP